MSLFYMKIRQSISVKRVRVRLHIVCLGLYTSTDFPKYQFLITFFCRPPLPVLLSAASGQGLQISGKLIRREGKVFYNLKFENHTQTPLDNFMIQFNKNTFGLAAGGPLQVTSFIDFKICVTQTIRSSFKLDNFH